MTPPPTLLRDAAEANLRRHVRWTDLYDGYTVQWRASGQHLGIVWRGGNGTWGWRCHRTIPPTTGDPYYTSRGHATKALLHHVADQIERECSDGKEEKEEGHCTPVPGVSQP